LTDCPLNVLSVLTLSADIEYREATYVIVQPANRTMTAARMSSSFKWRPSTSVRETKPYRRPRTAKTANVKISWGQSLAFFTVSHAARCVACHGVRSHAVPVALVGECSIPVT
jgi:hypothetical protein